MVMYLDSPVLFTPPDWSAMSPGQLDELRIQSVGSGLAAAWSAGTAIRRRGEFVAQVAGRGAIADLLAFHAGRRGRRLGFWAPSWLGDFRVVEPAAPAATELVIERVGIGELIDAHGEQFRHVAIIHERHLDPDWSGDEPELRRIGSVAVDGEREILTLDSGIDTEALPGKTLCSALVYARFARDGLPMRYLTDALVRATIAWTELPREYETARPGDAPVWLYEFSRGEETWRFADWGEDMPRGGETWQAASISHNSIRSDVVLLAEPVEIVVSTDDPEHPLRRLAHSKDRRTIGCRIFRADADDDQVMVLELAGELTRRPAASDRGEIVCEAATRLAVLGDVEYPRSIIQRRDNRHVYDSGINEAAWTTNGTVAAIGEDWVEAEAFGAQAAAESDPQWFAYGFVRFNGQVRTCRHQAGDRLYLSEGFEHPSGDLEEYLSEPVSASAGYDGSLSQRHHKFNDGAGHRGLAFMPDRELTLEPLEIDQDTSTRKK